MAIVKEERIGNQRLILGDCLKVMPLLGKFDAVVTDPPYEAIFHKNYKDTKLRRIDGGARRKNLNFESVDKIRPQLIKFIESFCNGWFLAFCSAEGVGNWRYEIVNNTKIKFKTTCIWVKPDCLPKLNAQGPAVGYEPFITTWNGNGHAKWFAGGKRGVYIHNTNAIDRHGKHPTEKPWRLLVEILQDFTAETQTILDPFLGSGTTLVACQKLGRHGTGIELNPDYFEIACKRVDEATRQPDLFISNEKTQEIPTQDAMVFEKEQQ